MVAEIIYRQATSDDYTGILSLYNMTYQSSRSISDLQWLYDHNPMGRGILFIAITNDTVIGMQGIVKYQFWRAQNIVNTYKSEDSLIHADYRGKGVYKKLYQLVFEFIEEIPIWGLTDKKKILERIGLPSEKQFVLAATVKGFVTPGVFKGENKVWPKTILYNGLNIRAFMSNKTSLKPFAYRTEPITNFIDIEDFGKMLSFQLPNIQVPILSRDLLYWRLRDNPKIQKWKVFAMLNSSNQIKGLSLVTMNGKKCRWLSTYFHKDVSQSYRANHILDTQQQLFDGGSTVIEQWLFDSNPVSQESKTLMLGNGFHQVKNGLWVVKNQPNKNASVHDILFSAQLGLY